MSGKAILFTLFVLGCMSLSLARPGGRRGGKGGGKPLGGACSAVNQTTGETTNPKTCDDGLACDRGPLSLQDCYGNTIQLTFCAASEEGDGSGRRCRGLAGAACSLSFPNGTTVEPHECEDGTCSLGPLPVDEVGTGVTAMFCQPAFSDGCPPSREDHPDSDAAFGDEGESRRRGHHGRGHGRGRSEEEEEADGGETPEGDSPAGEGPAEGAEGGDPPARVRQRGRGGRGGRRGGRGG